MLIILLILIILVALFFVLDKMEKHAQLKAECERMQSQNTQLKADILSLEEKSDQYLAELTSLRETINSPIDRTEEINMKYNQLFNQIYYIRSGFKHVEKGIDPANPVTSCLNPSVFEYFVIDQPENIVGGDFWYTRQFDNKTIINVGDCDGKGAAGFMNSFFVKYLFNEIYLTHQQAINSPAYLLMSVLRMYMQINQQQSLKIQTLEFVSCVIDHSSLMMHYANTHFMMYILRNTELIEIKQGMKYYIYQMRTRELSDNQIQLQHNDILYFVSNGFTNRINEKDQKYKRKNLREHIKSLADKTIQEQEIAFKNEISIGTYGLKDDIMVVGIKII